MWELHTGPSGRSTSEAVASQHLVRHSGLSLLFFPWCMVWATPNHVILHSQRTTWVGRAGMSVYFDVLHVIDPRPSRCLMLIWISSKDISWSKQSLNYRAQSGVHACPRLQMLMARLTKTRQVVFIALSPYFLTCYYSTVLSLQAPSPQLNPRDDCAQ